MKDLLNEFPDLCQRCHALTKARLSDPDTGERLCYACFTDEPDEPGVVVAGLESLREREIRERLHAIAYEGSEADHDFTMQLRYLAEKRGEKYSGPLLNRALLLELDDDRAEASPATYAREFLEFLGPPA